MKIAILIHGCHLQANAWENIVWGDPANKRFGRASRALELADKFKADLLIWGTGASEKDGQKECEYTYSYTVAHASQLPQYHGYDAYEIDSILRGKSVFDKEAQNTTEEVANALRTCHERGIDTLMLVSSPTHIARCVQEAEKVRAASNDPHAVTIMGTASDTCFANAAAGDVVIIEPPHRGDMKQWQTFRYARAMFGIMKGGDEKYEHFLNDFGELLEYNDIPVTWEPLRQAA